MMLQLKLLLAKTKPDFKKEHHMDLDEAVL